MKTKLESDTPLGAAPCSAFFDLRECAMNLRQDAIERGLDEKERYCRGLLDALRAVEKLCAWRDPKTDPPTRTGKILAWVDGRGPAIVNVEERWMCFWNGHDETEPTDPDEWTAWREISSPNETSPSAP
jgi:hypothetical protein